MSLYYVSESNPNDDVGGGGCLMSGEAKSEDCAGPFIIFTATTTDSATSPHAVLCAKCAGIVHEALVDKALLDSPHVPDSWKGDQPIIDIPDEDVVEVPLI